MPNNSHEDDTDQILNAIRGLIEAGTAFSVSILDDGDPRIKQAEAQGSHKALTNDGNCTQWVYVPGTGYVCVQHGKP